MNGVYAEFFVTHKPARVTVEVSKLPFGGKFECFLNNSFQALVEISCDAIILWWVNWFDIKLN